MKSDQQQDESDDIFMQSNPEQQEQQQQEADLPPPPPMSEDNSPPTEEYDQSSLQEQAPPMSESGEPEEPDTSTPVYDFQTESGNNYKLKPTTSGRLVQLELNENSSNLYNVPNVFPYDKPMDQDLTFVGLYWKSLSSNITGMKEVSAMFNESKYNDIVQDLVAKNYQILQEKMTTDNIEFIYNLKIETCSVANKTMVIMSGNCYTNNSNEPSEESTAEPPTETIQ